jgi:NitT/TauT family transport system ATP-binding protein
MSLPIIEVQDLCKTFGKKNILNSVSLTVKRGEFVSILGSSGCGKSTFLRLIAGLEPLTSGKILKPEPLRLSYVFQDPCLLPWLTVEENILLPFRILDKTPRRPEALEQILQTVGLGAHSDKFPHELSGGMKMRASIARALITEPEILLMDEPFAALDEATRFQLQDELLAFWKNQKLTVIFVTHSISESVYLSQRILFLDQGLRHFLLDKRIELSESREQKLKGTLQYNDYVTFFSEAFRGVHQ